MTPVDERDVRAMFAELLDLADPVDWSTVHYQRTPGWDSLVHMAIVTRLENLLQAPLTDDEITDMVDYASALTVLRSRGALLESAGTD